MSVALHLGMEHPELSWIVVASAITFTTGLAIGVVSARARGWLGLDAEPAAD